MVWQEALKEKDFEDRTLLLHAAYMPNFDLAACDFVMLLREHGTSFVLRLTDEGFEIGCVPGDEFVLMTNMGFFELAHDRYRMVIPNELTPAKIKAVVLAYIATAEGEGAECGSDFLLCPEKS